MAGTVDATAKSQTATTVTPTVTSTFGTTFNFPPPPSYAPKAPATPIWVYVLTGVAALFSIIGFLWPRKKKASE